MMRNIQITNKYRKDLKLCYKRGYKLTKLEKITEQLSIDGNLPPKNKAHKLSGNRAGQWECHIEPDWLLIYVIDDKSLTLIETGTHSDLFD
ncbi:MAG: type II toxin-antitoxin system YafQ family toxin [Pseudomonadota bacterium]